MIARALGAAAALALAAPALAHQFVYTPQGLPPAVRAVGEDLSCDLAAAMGAFGATHVPNPFGEVWLVPCRQADVNVEHFAVLREWSGAATLLRFAHPPGEGDEPSPRIVNPRLERGSVTATLFYGPDADCGRYLIYAFEPPDLPLTAMHEKIDCDGAAGDPRAWPVVVD